MSGEGGILVTLFLRLPHVSSAIGVTLETTCMRVVSDHFFFFTMARLTVQGSGSLRDCVPRLRYVTTIIPD
uniref:Putative secreted protein n=1 Tax=Anopheles darlingi TaxID=43151 RepID=A0A2M4DMU0_ANODA